jgi:hypothetical protein
MGLQRGLNSLAECPLRTSIQKDFVSEDRELCADAFDLSEQNSQLHAKSLELSFWFKYKYLKMRLATSNGPGKLMSRGTKKPQKLKRDLERAIINHIIRLERRVWKTAQRREADAFAKLVPSDAIMIFQSGIVPQPEYLAGMSERTISRYQLGNVRGFMPNTRTVILYYEALRLGEESGNAFPEGIVIESTTWIKRGRRWVAILNQETPIRKASHGS